MNSGTIAVKNPIPRSIRRCFLRASSDQRRATLVPMLRLRESVYFSKSEANLLIADVLPEDDLLLASEGVQVIPSRKYEQLEMAALDQVYQPLEHHEKSLNDVLTHIRARLAWKSGTGKGVHIAVVDTGICGGMPEFPAWKKSPYGWSYHGSHWTDLRGHGSMAACVAAATSSNGGRFDGVAPGATLISCKTSFDDTELYQVYDYLIGLVEKHEIGPLVISNSYGSYQCSPPDLAADDPFTGIVRLAVAKGITVVFAAGNNHVNVCGHSPLACGPNSIWGVNSLEEVISVGTVDETNRMDQPPKTANGFSHRDSSRGPGQFAKSRSKPDCVAPTYGEVMWGCGYAAMEWWGTSGAAPQVAGLAALLLGRNPGLSPAEVKEIIRSTAVRLPVEETCVGSGLINCEAALSQVV